MPTDETREAADRFINCVMHRYKSDTVMRGWLTIAILLLPTITIFFGTLLMAFKGNTDDELISSMGRLLLCLTFFILMIIIFISYRRLLDHSYRDREWRSALISYVGAYGLCTDSLIKIDNDIKKDERTIAEYPGLLILILYFVVMMFALAFPSLYAKYISSDVGSASTTLTIIGAILCFILILFVFLYVVRFPNLHENGQIKFTVELARLMKLRDLDLGYMQKSVKYVHGVAAFILLVVTAGIYSLWMIYKVYKCVNDHIFNQWSYETRLMNMVIKKEEGVEIVPAYVRDDE